MRENTLRTIWKRREAVSRRHETSRHRRLFAALAAATTTALAIGILTAAAFAADPDFGALTGR